MSRKKNVILDIVPLTRIPLDKNRSFSYLSEKNLHPGTLVSIPLFRRNLEGIVLGARPDFPRLGNIELKNVNKIVEENFLDNRQMELADFISEYYFSPLGIVFKAFIPKRTKLRSKNQEVKSKNNSRKIQLTREQSDAVKEITKIYPKFKIQNFKFLLHGPASSGKTEVYIHAILKLATRNPQLQFLILLPELTLTPQAIERYGEYFPVEEIAVLHSKISKGQFYSNWQKIKSGKAKIIIGSRMAIFAPFKNLGLIVIDEEQDISFKQWDMNPRYDARTVAEKLAEAHQCPIVFGSAAPRIVSYWRALNKKINLLTLPPLKIKVKSGKNNALAAFCLPPVTIELVDIKKERWNKNQSPVSKKLQSEISFALKNKLQTILFINRQGMSAFSICAGCKEVLKCPKCDRALLYDRKGIYKCAHCRHKTSITPRCSKCNGIAFRNIGLGTQKVEKEILSLFPGARIARADSQTMQALHAQEDLYSKFKNREIDILIGTQMISKGWDLPSVSLAGIIDGDNMLAFPDFSASEKTFQNIMQVAGRVGRLGAKFPGQVIIQTFHPEQAFWKALAAKNYRDFYQEEINEREALKLPPFAKIIKLVFQNYSAEKVFAETRRIFIQLKSESGKSSRISEPQDSFTPKIRGRYRKQIVIKIAKEPSGGLKNILGSLPNGWIVDVDPVSII